MFCFLSEFLSTESRFTIYCVNQIKTDDYDNITVTDYVNNQWRTVSQEQLTWTRQIRDKVFLWANKRRMTWTFLVRDRKGTIFTTPRGGVTRCRQDSGWWQLWVYCWVWCGWWVWPLHPLYQVRCGCVCDGRGGCVCTAGCGVASGYAFCTLCTR